MELDDGKLRYGKVKERLKEIRAHLGGTRKLHDLIEANFLVRDACFWQMRMSLRQGYFEN